LLIQDVSHEKPNKATRAVANQLNSRLEKLVSLVMLASALSCCASGCHMAATGQNLEGVRLYQQGEYPAAMQKFQQAVATDPASADAYYNMAATVHRMGTLGSNPEMLQQAETLYNQCLDLNADHVDCHRGLAVLLAETGRSDKAFTLLKNWSSASPQVADARIELARLYEEFGDNETAKLHLDQAIQIDHQNHRAWSALGHMREKAGDPTQALVDYQRSYHLNNFQPDVAARIAELQRTVRGSYSYAPAGGTRTVISRGPPTRY
jgi:tetratricopeptide (TPR) repeat protein